MTGLVVVVVDRLFAEQHELGLLALGERVQRARDAERLEPRRAGIDEDRSVARVWDEQLDPQSNTVRMTVMTLRRKLGDPPLIETVRGSGYRV